MSMIGHNNPPLDETHADLAKRAAAAVGDLDFTTVENDRDAANLAQAGKNAREIIVAIDTARKEAKEPHLQAGRDIDAYFKSLAAPVEEFVAGCKRLIGEYQQRKEAAARAAAAEAARIARDAAEAELAAARTADQFEAAAQRADDAEQAAANAVTAKPAELARVTSGGYAVASVRETWTFEVVDASLLPREYLMPNEARIKAVIAGKHGLMEIPGLRIFAKRTTVL